MLDRFEAEGYAASRVALSWSADLRFQGQASEIRLQLPGHRLDGPGIPGLERGTSKPNTSGFTATARTPRTPLKSSPCAWWDRWPPPGGRRVSDPGRPAFAAQSRRQACFGSDYGLVDTPVVARSDLSGTARGPLLIDEYDSTIVVPPFMSVRRDEHGNVVMEVEDE